MACNFSAFFQIPVVKALGLVLLDSRVFGVKGSPGVGLSAAAERWGFGAWSAGGFACPRLGA